MRRHPALLAVVLGALVLGLQPAPVARAQLAATEVEFLFSPAGSLGDASWTPQAGSVVTGTWQIRVRATSTGALERVQVQLESEEESLAAAGAGPPERRYPLLPARHADELSFEWDTATLTPRNGRYRWVAEASSHLGTVARTVLGDLKVNNPPAPPGSVEVRLDGATPVVTWGGAPEPDVVSYRIWRAPEGTDLLEPVGTAQGPEFRDEGAPPGGQTYEVNAVRRSPISSRGIASQLSGRTAAVQVPGVVPSPAVLGAQATPSIPTVQGAPQSAGKFSRDLPYATPPPQGPASPPPKAADPPAPPAAAGVGQVTAADRQRFSAAGILLLAAALLAWRMRRRLLTGR